MQGVRGDVSDSAFAHWQNLFSLGLNVDQPVGGRLGIRGHAGNVFRWGAGWFEPVRDGGVGWNFAKDAKPAIDERVQI